MQETRRINAVDPLHVPRPLEKWLASLTEEKTWKDHEEKSPWYKMIKGIASDHGCGIILDKRRHWRESVYREENSRRSAVILAGGSGRSVYVCTVLLHELGHHLARLQGQGIGDILEREHNAWRIAASLAAENGFPFVAKIRRQSLYSYRLAVILRETRGSKAKNKIRPLPKSFQIATSRRSAPISVPQFYDAVGKKGKRGVKREIKRATSKAERRKNVGRGEA